MQYALVGLGAMGMGMAKSMLKNRLKTYGVDVDKEKLAEFKRVGGKTANRLSSIANSCDTIIFTLVNSEQIDSVLLPSLDSIKKGALIISCSTVAPDYIKSLNSKLKEREIRLIDAPISGGSIKANQGKITVMASGATDDIALANPFFEAVSENFFKLGDEIGKGSTMKVVHQLLAGVHIAAAAEAIAMGVKAGLNPQTMFDIVTKAAGNSWMFENRVPHIINNDFTPHSAVNIFVKDLLLVKKSAENLNFSVPLADAAFKQFEKAQKSGHGEEDDSAVIKVYKNSH